jgi:uncharacterized protein YcfL
MKNLFNLILCSLVFSACGSSPEVTTMDMPKWASQQPDLCGLGIYKTKNNLSAARTFAIARARVDLSRQIETKVKSMIKDYAASGEEESNNFTEELTRNASVNLSKTTINGSIPSKLALVNENVFSLVCLKPNVLTDAINNMNLLNEAQRKALQRRSKIAHEDLKEQMKRYND